MDGIIGRILLAFLWSLHIIAVVAAVPFKGGNSTLDIHDKYINIYKHNIYTFICVYLLESNHLILSLCDRIPSTTPGAEPPRGTKDSGSARSHSTHLETSSQKRP